jgi:outer membrane protein TolC
MTTDIQQQASLEQATAKLKAAEGELTEAQNTLQSFVTQNFRSSPAGLIYVSADDRDVLDDDLKALVVTVDKAKGKFHKALSEWAALK